MKAKDNIIEFDEPQQNMKKEPFTDYDTSHVTQAKSGDSSYAKVAFIFSLLGMICPILAFIALYFAGNAKMERCPNTRGYIDGAEVLAVLEIIIWVAIIVFYVLFGNVSSLINALI